MGLKHNENVYIKISERRLSSKITLIVWTFGTVVIKIKLSKKQQQQQQYQQTNPQKNKKQKQSRIFVPRGSPNNLKFCQ